ncbi:Nucleoside-triphosphatase [Pyrolobus fumarii 1A]|uniref:Nucleoside-triphosphatase Pyrfu_1823 n=1 Tax=Pyrolobus fumarii (strain DSM 11204 / 1A) TaxID=694429 RepID=G0ECV7_PYRF1|nr:nucleoside-triphosphatase [Pyrolobus fumarii]AEM39677.1 Nucleoside-triphosphatase [Pyrolobus fumarii 1A]
MPHRFVVITGRPGVGKTTLFRKVVGELRSMGYRVEGFACPEVRVGGRRIGFKIVSLDGSLEAWLAKAGEECDGPRVGRYRVCREAEDVARAAVERALREADIIGIDEIGPMELKTRGIRAAILAALRSGKPGIYVAHARLSDIEILPLLKSEGVWFTVTVENRDLLPPKVLEAALEAIRGGRR